MIFLVFNFFVSPAWGEEAKLKDIVLTNTSDYYEVYFTVTNCFTEEMREAIDNGVPTRFTFFVELREVRELWWDRQIVSHKINHEIHYEGLKNVYTVKLSEAEDKILSFEEFKDAKNAMSQIKGVKVVELDQLETGQHYQVRIMAELDKIRLPFYLHYVFFFLSLWDFETPWYIIDFTYQ